MSGESKRVRTTDRRAEKVTADALIAEATSSRFKLSDDQVEQSKILLQHNDVCDSVKHKVSLVRAWRFLKQHYDLKMGTHMFEKLICEKLGRSSWGQK
jgi:hypothetical protein